MPGNLLFIVAFFLGLASTAQAKELFGPEAGVVPFGMGRAYSAVADDWLSLYYNPAGLALVSGVDFQAFDIKVATDTAVLESYKNISNLSDGNNNNAQKLSNYAGKHVQGQLSNFSQITVPYFAFGASYEANVDLDLQNLSYPTTQLRYTKDFKVSAGGALAFGPRKALRVGLAVSMINRRGGTQDIGVQEIIGAQSALVDRFNYSGTGWSGTFGVQYRLPTKGREDYTLSYVWHDMGNTTFGRYSATQRPTQIDQNMVAGFAVRYPIGGKRNRRYERRYGPQRSSNALTFALDYSHLNLGLDKEMLPKHLHAGVNIDLPILALQFGINQSSFTYGMSFDAGVVRVNFASYGEELGSFAGQRRDRRYMLSVASSLGFK